MMRKWLSRQGAVETEMMTNLGFAFDSSVKWWFNDTTKMAISHKDSLKYPIEVMSLAPFAVKLYDITFLSTVKINRDILDTIYLKHYGRRPK